MPPGPVGPTPPRERVLPPQRVLPPGRSPRPVRSPRPGQPRRAVRSPRPGQPPRPVRAPPRRPPLERRRGQGGGGGGSGLGPRCGLRGPLAWRGRLAPGTVSAGQALAGRLLEGGAAVRARRGGAHRLRRGQALEALPVAGHPQDRGDRVGRLRADAQPVLHAVGVDLDRRRLVLRVVLPHRLDRPAVPLGAGVGDDDAVVRLAHLADAHELDSGGHGCGCSNCSTGGRPAPRWGSRDGRRRGGRPPG